MALVTSAIVNANRAPDSPALSPFYFLAGYEQDPAEKAEEERRREVKRGIAVAMTRLPDDMPPEAVKEMRDKIIARVRAAGFEDAEELYREVFAD